MTPRWPSYLTLRYLPKRNENTCPHKDLCKNVHSSFIKNSPALETTHMSINRTMASVTMWHHLATKGTNYRYTDNMDESQKQYAKHKKSVIKMPIWVIPLCEVQEETNLITSDRNQSDGCPWRCWLETGLRALTGAMEMVYTVIGGGR